MFYKLVQSTDFDAIEGGMMMTTKEIIAVTSADDPKIAREFFEYLKRKGIIYYSEGAVEVEEATRDEFEIYIKNS